MRLLLFILIFLNNQQLFAQHPEFGKEWITGIPHLSKTIFTSNNSMNVFLDSTITYLLEGASSICDSSGKLLLFCNGGSIRRASDLMIIENGDHIFENIYYSKDGGLSLYGQQSIILPFPDSIYFVITCFPSDSMMTYGWNIPGPLKLPFDKINYNVVDMKMNGGLGKVVNKNVNISSGRELSKTQMMACLHGNGEDWWLLKVASDSTAIYKFLLTRNGFNYEGKFCFNHVVMPWPGYLGIFDNMGALTFSPDGKHMVTGCNSGYSEMFMADFDRCNGNISNPKRIPIPTPLSGTPSNLPDSTILSFVYSPNGRFIYVLKYRNILQFDTESYDSSTSWYHVANMDTTFNQFMGYNSLGLGYNGKLYVGNSNGFSYAMSVIDSPNNKGVACSFCPKCCRFDHIGTGTPLTMPNWNLGKENCSKPTPTVPELLLYPIPMENSLNLISSDFIDKFTNIIIYNMLGQTVVSKKVYSKNSKIQIDVSYLKKGMYILHVGDFVKKVVKE